MVPAIAHNHANGIAARTKQRQNVVGLVAKVLFIHGMLRRKNASVGRFAVQIYLIGTVAGGIKSRGNNLTVHGECLAEQRCRASVAKARLARLCLFLRCDPLCCPLVCGQQRCLKPAALLGCVSVVILHRDFHRVAVAGVQRFPRIGNVGVFVGYNRTCLHDCAAVRVRYSQLILCLHRAGLFAAQLP